MNVIRRDELSYQISLHEVVPHMIDGKYLHEMRRHNCVFRGGWGARMNTSYTETKASLIMSFKA